MTAEHNHPPRCCCEADTDPRGSNERIDCPLCVEHGELAQLGKECPSCHTTAGHPHTDYCPVTLAQQHDADPRVRRADGYTHAQALEHCICVTSGPDAYGPDENCPLHGANPTIRPAHPDSP